MSNITLATGKRRVLELSVNNHAGVMSHICGLFSRRAFNMEGILCIPETAAATSRIWLVVQDDDRLEQLIKQLRKLYDVLEVRQHDPGHDVFTQWEAFFQGRA